MKTKIKKDLWFYVIVLALAVAILCIFIRIVGGGKSSRAEAPEATPLPTPEVIIQEKEVERIVEVEKVFTAVMIRDGLRDLGELATEEYYFTEVISHSTMLELKMDLRLFQINSALPLTESSFLASYDGVVTAGIDFTGVTVEKNDGTKEILVTLPAAKILHVDIDPESFRLYDEKKGLGTRITVEDYNNALTQLENTASDKAVERGLLEKADENARTVVRNFILSLLGPGEYTVRIVSQS